MRAGNSDRGGAFTEHLSLPRRGQGLRCFPPAVSTLAAFLPVFQLHIASLVFSTTHPQSPKSSFSSLLFCFRVPRTQFGLSFVHLLVDVLRFQEASFCVFFAFVSSTLSCSVFESNSPSSVNLDSLRPRAAGYSLSYRNPPKSARLPTQRVSFQRRIPLPVLYLGQRSGELTLDETSFFPLCAGVGPEICTSAALFGSEQVLFPRKDER
ncbi:hypothetical protein CONLIGDRAFT_1488 [Coniochaeta ligniaria NRRL 30616]|uniref:Uncharacterized protein n=1 Tax=Coniochaeta ligniaria NRRL 30616 TaxID=1408157 RepID=A0A1J7JLS9_9PEZI|nr:hypothetical protein CONLIGDRAFT_1488 [Coniochaeta ligniaria NRRL 30616]